MAPAYNSDFPQQKRKQMIPATKKRVLIIEDDAEIRNSFVMIVNSSQKFGVVNSYGNCEDAIKHLAQDKPDYVLMDIELPGQDGITTTRQLLTANPTARVLMVTGYDDADMRNAATAAGACGYVLKENLQELRHWFQVINTIETTYSTHLPAAEKGKNR